MLCGEHIQKVFPTSHWLRTHRTREAHIIRVLLSFSIRFPLARTLQPIKSTHTWQLCLYRLDFSLVTYLGLSIMFATTLSFRCPIPWCYTFFTADSPQVISSLFLFGMWLTIGCFLFGGMTSIKKRPLLVLPVTLPNSLLFYSGPISLQAPLAMVVTMPFVSIREHDSRFICSSGIWWTLLGVIFLLPIIMETTLLCFVDTTWQLASPTSTGLICSIDMKRFTSFTIYSDAPPSTRTRSPFVFEYLLAVFTVFRFSWRRTLPALHALPPSLVCDASFLFTLNLFSVRANLFYLPFELVG